VEEIDGDTPSGVHSLCLYTQSQTRKDPSDVNHEKMNDASTVLSNQLNKRRLHVFHDAVGLIENSPISADHY